MKISKKDFDRVVKRAVRHIPEEIRQHLDNILIAVQKRPSPELLEEMDLPPDELARVAVLDGGHEVTVDVAVEDVQGIDAQKKNDKSDAEPFGFLADSFRGDELLQIKNEAIPCAPVEGKSIFSQFSPPRRVLDYQAWFRRPHPTSASSGKEWSPNPYPRAQKLHRVNE